MARFLLCLLAICLTFEAGWSQPLKSTLGLAKKRPAEGRFVETPRGFMVPYTTKIKGTDVEFTMVPVPGGEYKLRRNGVTHTVVIEPFWMGRTEVTWGEYREYMKLVDYFRKFKYTKQRLVMEENKLDAITAPSAIYDLEWHYSAGRKPNQPAVSMRQFAAKQYTKYISLLQGEFYRLPSEAEWEYACAAGSKANYSFGNDEDELEQYAWYYDEEKGNDEEWETDVVATRKPNRWGFYDMHGNAAEWVLDGVTTVEKLPAPNSRLTVEQSIVWPQALYGRITKGGSWAYDAEDCRISSRFVSDDNWDGYDPNSPKGQHWLTDEAGLNVGFRVLRPLATPARKDQEKYWEADCEEIRKALKTNIEYHGQGARGLVDSELPAAIRRLLDEQNK